MPGFSEVLSTGWPHFALLVAIVIILVIALVMRASKKKKAAAEADAFVSIAETNKILAPVPREGADTVSPIGTGSPTSVQLRGRRSNSPKDWDVVDDVLATKAQGF